MVHPPGDLKENLLEKDGIFFYAQKTDFPNRPKKNFSLKVIF